MAGTKRNGGSIVALVAQNDALIDVYPNGGVVRGILLQTKGTAGTFTLTDGSTAFIDTTLTTTTGTEAFYIDFGPNGMEFSNIILSAAPPTNGTVMLFMA